MRRLRSVLFGVLSLVILLSGAVPAFAAIGDFVGKWGTQGNANGQFDNPVGVAVAANGDVYVADSHNQRIQRFDAAGGYKGQWGSGGVLAGQFAYPVGVAVAPGGDVYVIELHGHRVQRFSADGTYKGMWGSQGSGPGQFEGAWDIAVAPNGDVYVVDTGNSRIQYFSSTGVFKGRWGTPGTDGGQFLNPRAVAVAPGGDVFVADTGNNRIQYFSPAGAFKGTWGSAGPGDGQFALSHGIAVAPLGYVYVSDKDVHRIQYFEGPSLPAPATISVAGVDRYTTAAKTSLLAFPTGAEAVVIATGANWPDALGGTSLAGAVDGPILLVERARIPSSAMVEVIRLQAKRAFILGGPNAVGAEVEAALKLRLGAKNVIRIAGADRYQTAERVASRVMSELGPAFDRKAIFATGADFPDALAAAPLAARQRWPLYLVDPARGLSAGTKTAMTKVDHAVVLGGTAVVSAATEEAIMDATGNDTQRLSGADRYATAVAVARFAVEERQHAWNRVGITTGTAFPDALAGGVLQARVNSVMLLTTPTALNPRTANALSANKKAIDTVTFFGGTKAVSTEVRTQVGNLVK